MKRLQTWTATYQFRAARDADEAAKFARYAATQDVPDAEVHIIKISQTQTGRFSVQVRRVRND